MKKYFFLLVLLPIILMGCEKKNNCFEKNLECYKLVEKNWDKNNYIFFYSPEKESCLIAGGDEDGDVKNYWIRDLLTNFPIFEGVDSSEWVEKIKNLKGTCKGK